jgi:ATP-dependent Clp protease, protease subunit
MKKIIHPVNDEYDVIEQLDFDSSTSLEHAGVYLFAEEFTNSSVSPAIKFILSQNLLPAAQRPKQLTMLIMSDGGDLTSCFGLIDVMMGSSIPIHTVGLGSIASCGFLTFISGTPGQRIITPNTSIMCHQFSWNHGGKVHELLAADLERERTQNRMLAHIKHCTKLKTEQEIKKYLLPPHDVYLDAKDAVKWGVADRITHYYPLK